jgi:hypothetical protein
MEQNIIMDKEFIKLAEKIIDERGKTLLFDNRITKALFLDYGRCEFRNEINFLVKTIELGYTKKIMDSDDLDITKMILSRQLIEEHFINDKIANSIILLLIGLLRDKNYLNEIYEGKINKSIETDMVEKERTEINTIMEQVKPENVSAKKNMIKIKRIENVFGSALSTGIRIDNEITYRFFNGEVKIFPIENGKHILFASFNDDYDKLEFEINNNFKAFNIVIKPHIKIIEAV